MKKTTKLLAVMLLTISIFVLFASATEVRLRVGANEDDYITFDTSTGTIIEADWYIQNAIIPSTINGVTVLHIAPSAFIDCKNLSSITLPDTLISIGEGAFAKCTALTSINIPDSVTTIGDNAFFGCTSLESISMPSSLEKINYGTFGYCSKLESIEIPQNVTSISENAFYSCSSLTSISIPSAVRYIGFQAFVNCEKLKTVTVDSETLFLDSEIFYGCNDLTIFANENSSIIEYASLYGISYIATKANTAEVLTAKATDSSIIWNGEEINLEAYTIDGNNYFKLRDIAFLTLGSEKEFNVQWNTTLKAIMLITAESYEAVGGELSEGDGSSKEFTKTSSTIYLDGVDINLTAYNINENNYFKLRDICSIFDISVLWDGEANAIVVDTSLSYTE